MSVENMPKKKPRLRRQFTLDFKAEIAALCRRLGSAVDHIGLHVRADNATAIGLYRRLGFTDITDFTEATHAALA
ncbi:GNAT family N-acetyltransferase [Streptomyces sp. NBC_01351]|uniref:GNAT family N-acetyltransferase n=1 Tax=Streptomyces sp. NBC_01351 TaxID=2903833 RepID=UPI002E314FE1|nr:GNAT family N-acetyltransferase [Streptomyces sp. NBC_01351]